MNIVERLSQIGFATRRELVGIGYACRVFFALLRVAPASFRRFGLIRDQIYFLGNHSLAIITVSGLFVGFGTRLGGGCTSGHGVCGMGLGSRDSIVATLTFMAAGFVTVAVWNAFL